MVKLENLHKYHLALLALLSIGCGSLHELCLYYITQHFRDYDKNDSEEKSFGKFLQFFKTSHEGIFKNLDIAKHPQFTSTIFTDDTKQNVKGEVNSRMLDITSICDVLENTSFFPSSKIKHRRNLHCKSSIHIGRCCPSCDGKHLCSTCNKNKCKVNCCSPPGCDHPCSNISCLAKLSDCYENSTVCCKNCGLCFYCMGSVLNNCDDRVIREVIKVINMLRNLVAHSNDDTWENLNNGTFSSPDFPNSKSWNDLSSKIHAKLLELLCFLERNKAISIAKCDGKKYELNIIIEAREAELLKQFRDELIVEYTRTMIENVTKKSLYLKFEVELLNNKELQRRSLQLNGKVMTSICEIIKEVISNETSSSSNSLPEVIREKCELVHRHDPQALKVKFKIESREENLCQYKDPASDISKDLWEKFSNWMKDGLLHQFGVKVDLWQEQWRLGSVIITVAIVKNDKTLWSVEEVEFVHSRIKGFEGFFENVEITILPRKEKTQEQKIKFAFRIVGVQNIFHNELELIKSKATNIVNGKVDIKDVKEGPTTLHSVQEHKILEGVIPQPAGLEFTKKKKKDGESSKAIVRKKEMEAAVTSPEITREMAEQKSCDQNVQSCSESCEPVTSLETRVEETVAHQQHEDETDERIHDGSDDNEDEEEEDEVHVADLIEQNHLELVTNLDLERQFMFSYLRSKSILDEEDCERIINTGNTRQQKASIFLDVIKRKGSNGMKHFIDALGYEYPELYKKITGNEAASRGLAGRNYNDFDPMVLAKQLEQTMSDLHRVTKLHQKLQEEKSMVDKRLFEVENTNRLHLEHIEELKQLIKKISGIKKMSEEYSSMSNNEALAHAHCVELAAQRELVKKTYMIIALQEKLLAQTDEIENIKKESMAEKRKNVSLAKELASSREENEHILTELEEFRKYSEVLNAKFNIVSQEKTELTEHNEMLAKFHDNKCKETRDLQLQLASSREENEHILTELEEFRKYSEVLNAKFNIVSQEKTELTEHNEMLAYSYQDAQERIKKLCIICTEMAEQKSCDQSVQSCSESCEPVTSLETRVEETVAHQQHEDETDERIHDGSDDNEDEEEEDEVHVADLIEQNHLELVTNLDLERQFMFSYLRSKSILDEEDCEQIINTGNTRQQKASIFLDVIKRKGSNGMKHFIDALGYEYPELYKKITGNEAASRVTTLPSSLSLSWTPGLEFTKQKKKDGESSKAIVRKKEMEAAVTSPEITRDKGWISKWMERLTNRRGESSTSTIIHEVTHDGRKWSFDDVYRLLEYKQYATFRKLFEDNRNILNNLRGGLYNSNFLMFASLLDVPHVVEHLTNEFKDNIDVWAVDEYGFNAYHRAAMRGNDDVMKMLLSFDRSRLNDGDNGGYTPLHWAVRFNKKRIVELLLNAGADVDVENHNGQTPDRLASVDDDIRKIIQHHRTKSTDVTTAHPSYSTSST